MNIIAVCVYNRIENIKHLFHCWAQCKHDALLVIVHNHYGEPGLMEQFKALCDAAGVIYVPRNKPGFDIGAFQDVCRDRLNGFPEHFDNLLWMCDDTYIMQKDFYQPFFDQLRDPKIGVTCMEISPYVRQHIRTTGFAIRKETTQRLIFPADPITTKEDCYQFEHRSKIMNFHAQVVAMGLKVVQVAPSGKSPLFDTGYHRRLQYREKEHFKLFGNEAGVIIENNIRPLKSPYPLRVKSTLNEFKVITDHLPKVVFICPIYDKYPQIVSALICQTYSNWELWLVHDGPAPLDLPDDKRIIYEKRERKGNDWGHSFRKEYINKVDGQYLVISNPDNYLVPTFIEYMLKGFRPGIVATYCDAMVHSYKAHQVIPCRLERGYVDCSGVMVRMDVAKEIGWNSMDHSADWFYFADIIKAKGVQSFSRVRGCLLIHN